LLEGSELAVATSHALRGVDAAKLFSGKAGRMTSQKTLKSIDATDPRTRHERELDVLATIGRLLAGQTSQERTLSAVLDQLERRLGFERASVRLVSPDGTELIVGADFPARACPSDDPESSEYGFLRVPIVLAGQVVGTLSADIRQTISSSLAEHTRVLGVVANLIALDAQTRHRAKLDRHNLEVENQRLRAALQERHRPDTKIGNLLPGTLPMPEGDKPAAASLTDRVELLEKDLIVDALRATRGNVAAAARRLGITPRIIRYKIRKLRISGKV
jgi:hypothetical protein